MSSVPLPVEVRDLHKRFPRMLALAGLSFAVNPGEIVGLLGANGAGKTPTIHILLGLILPTSGSVALFGHGPRQCIGRSFALTEALLFVAPVLQRFHLDLLPGQTVVPEPLVTSGPGVDSP